MMSNCVKELAKFIKNQHRPEAKHMQTVPAKVLVEENVICDGAMEVFGRPAAGHGLKVDFNLGCSWD
jgi:hypothetical protein